MGKFKIGDIVCLYHDKTKRFIVKSNIPVNGKILLTYFDEAKYLIADCEIESDYLILAPKQD
jgi:hypothetical protein